ncbi:MAG: hypothetical protein IPF99_05650 [Deltaproteobacteria bacterium]|jgi:hypothetical protein|nr:hypothetical protein [Deltaproteobacteria bacterium]MBP6834177.1 hypothetical protein [Deltaproteobacteria bacterium]
MPDLTPMVVPRIRCNELPVTAAPYSSGYCGAWVRPLGPPLVFAPVVSL